MIPSTDRPYKNYRKRPCATAIVVVDDVVDVCADRELVLLNVAAA